MGELRLTVECVGEIKEKLADQFMRQAARLGCAYADLRLEVVESQFAWAENGHSKQSGKDETLAFGIRVIAGEGVRAPGYYGQSLGAADWGYEDVWRNWYDADERVMVEIRERSWLKSAPQDVMDQRTCAVLRFRGDKICEMRDYADSHIYEEFAKRHRSELPKVNRR